MKSLASDRVLIFDIWGDYACFRRFYTTRSPLSYSFPPRPTLAGLVGAILGVPKEEVAKKFCEERAQFALRIMRPIKRIRLGVNWVETKGQALKTGRVTERTQILAEFLKDPYYRVYVRFSDRDRAQQLSEHLQQHLSVYTPCLGLSELLADFRWVGEEEINPLQEGKHEIHTVLPTDRILWPPEGSGVEFGQGKRYEEKRMPRFMNADRQVTDWHDVLYETTGGTVTAHVKEAYQVGDNTIVFL
jgi:CRISPR-associated protein Cas5h